MTLLVPPALLAVVVAVGVLGGQSKVVPAPAPVPPKIPVASQPLTAAVAADGPLGPMLIPYEWRGKLGDRVDRFTIDDTVLLAAPRADHPRTVDRPYPR